jgi:hypothetical protein
MSKKCKAYSASKLDFAPHDNRKAFYSGWDAAIAQHQPRKPLTDEEMRALWESHGYKSALCMRFARAIERAHGIGGEE